MCIQICMHFCIHTYVFNLYSNSWAKFTGNTVISVFDILMLGSVVTRELDVSAWSQQKVLEWRRSHRDSLAALDRRENHRMLGTRSLHALDQFLLSWEEPADRRQGNNGNAASPPTQQAWEGVRRVRASCRVSPAVPSPRPTLARGAFGLAAPWTSTRPECGVGR